MSGSGGGGLPHPVSGERRHRGHRPRLRPGLCAVGPGLCGGPGALRNVFNLRKK